MHICSRLLLPSSPRPWQLAAATHLLLTGLLLASAVLFAGLVHAAPLVEETKQRNRDLHGDPLPPGAIARLGTTRLRPGTPRVRCAFSPDSKILATGEEKKLRFWEVATGKEIRSVEFPDYVWVVRSLVFSPDGKRFAANGDNQFIISRGPGDQSTIYIGDVASGKILHRFKEENTGFGHVEFSADGKLLAARQTGIAALAVPRRYPDLIVWDSATGKTVQRFSDVLSWSFSPDGKSLMVGRKDGAISLYDSTTGQQQQQFSGHRSDVLALAFSRNGKTLASGGGRTDRAQEKEVDQSVRLWDVATGKERWQIKGNGQNIVRVAFAPDGQSILSMDDSGTVSLSETKTGKQHQQFPGRGRGYAPDDFAFSPDRKYLVRSAPDGLHDWDIAAGKESRHWGSAESLVASITFSPDGKFLVSSGECLRLWDVKAAKEMHLHPGHRTAVRSLCFSSDGKVVASLEENRTLCLWESATGKRLLAHRAGQKGGVIRYAFGQDGNTLIAVGSDGLVYIWESATGKPLRTFRVGEEKQQEENRIGWLSGKPSLDWNAETRLEFAPDRKTLAVATADNVIHLWDSDGKELQQLKGGEDLDNIHFAPDGKTVAARGKSKTIFLWDVATGKETGRFQGDVFAFSPDSRLLAWANDKGVYLWDRDAGKELRRWPAIGTRETSLAFSGDSKTLAAGTDGLIRLWEVSTGNEIRRLEGDPFDLGNVQLYTASDGRIFARYSLDGKHSRKAFVELATGRRIDTYYPYSRDQLTLAPDGRTWAKTTDTLTLRALVTGKSLGELPTGHRGSPTALVYSPDGKRLATASTDTTILIWDVSGFNRQRFPEAFTFTPKELDDLWTGLLPVGRWPDRSAYHALLGTSEQTVPFLRQCLRRLPVVDPKQVAKWVTDLDNDEFAVRKKALEELTKLGKLAAPALRKALAGKPSPELQKRAEELLDPNGSGGKLPPDWQRAAEALQILEQMNTAAARQSLEEQSQASSDSWLMEEAKAALDRLARRQKPR